MRHFVAMCGVITIALGTPAFANNKDAVEGGMKAVHIELFVMDGMPKSNFLPDVENRGDGPGRRTQDNLVVEALVHDDLDLSELLPDVDRQEDKAEPTRKEN